MVSLVWGSSNNILQGILQLVDSENGGIVLSLKQMDPLTVQEERMFSCCLMAVSLVNVALVRFLKNGNPMQEVLAAPLLVLLEGGDGWQCWAPLASNPCEKPGFSSSGSSTVPGVKPSPLPGKMWAISSRDSQSGMWGMSPLLLAPLQDCQDEVVVHCLHQKYVLSVSWSLCTGIFNIRILQLRAYCSVLMLIQGVSDFR